MSGCVPEHSERSLHEVGESALLRFLPSNAEGIDREERESPDSGGAIADATLSAARLAIRSQTGLSGQRISATPKYLLVPPAQETTAENGSPPSPPPRPAT
jgi:hypothetical protein